MIINIPVSNDQELLYGNKTFSCYKETVLALESLLIFVLFHAHKWKERVYPLFSFMRMEEQKTPSVENRIAICYTLKKYSVQKNAFERSWNRKKSKVSQKNRTVKRTLCAPNCDMCSTGRTKFSLFAQKITMYCGPRCNMWYILKVL